ncbi:MAG: FeoC-like transcriptional regulator [Acidihalobacter sp.]|uniref:FeoC-like transcriptional regulator n=1 Tax=Acidihalobacter sp. TaxID=1872108 RepID=UPI00307FC4A7
MNPLFAVRDRLREEGEATASQLAAILHLPRGTVEDMLAHWQRRGRVEPVVLGFGNGCASGCGGGACSSCSAPPVSAGGVRIYRWCEAGRAAPQPVRFHSTKALGE